MIVPVALEKGVPTRVAFFGDVLARELAGEGHAADLVVGNHTHVVQGTQMIDGVQVFYGLGNFVFDQDWDLARKYHIQACMECGCCAHVCPSNIPLVHYYRYATTAIWTQERERQRSDGARRRHEARLARLERLEAERKAKLRKKKEALEKQPATGADPKKAAIEAAMKRVAAKKAAQRTADAGGAGD